MHQRVQFWMSLAASAALCQVAQADTFGSGVNSFEIELVTIGDPGNAADDSGIPTPAGAVDYVYRIGKFEISESMVIKANAETAGTANSLGITTTSNGTNRAAGAISWFEAAHFVNWLSKSTGGVAAYKFDSAGILQHWAPGDAGYDPNNHFRNSLANYFLPSAHEWYKAAYYDPALDIYYDYPTGSNTAPTAVASGTAPGTSVFAQHPLNDSPANINQAGGLSPYGTMGQGGNVLEWLETRGTVLNPLPSINFTTLRGGDWGTSNASLQLSTADFGDSPPTLSGVNGGFRVARRDVLIFVPEPHCLALAALAAVGLLFRRRRLP